jgi:hypothetical protein
MAFRQESGVLQFNPDRVRANAEDATTEDLLDRVTVYRDDMEPEALEIFEAELARRKVTCEQIAAHADARRANLLTEGTSVRRCSRCFRPAVHEGWHWHRLFGVIPLFPRLMTFCEDHRPR